jgi:hypothetical protein
MSDQAERPVCLTCPFWDPGDGDEPVELDNIGQCRRPRC